jgi:site-specific recombinase XerD
MPRQSVVPGFRFDGRRKRACFEVTLPGTGGRLRRRKTVEASTREEALNLFAQFRAASLSERSAKPEFFSDYVRLFWPMIRMRLGARTADEESLVVAKILNPFFGSYRLQKINAALIRDFVAFLRSQSYAASTINRTVSLFRKILNDAVAREVVTEFPAKGRLPKEKEIALRLELSGEEKSRFLNAFDDESRFRGHFSQHRPAGRVVSSQHFGGARRVFGGGLRPEGEAVGQYFERFRAMKPLFVIALETGLRRGDLLGLRWSSVNFEQGWIRVAMQKTRREALIPISVACREALLECRHRHVLNEFVFISAEGKPLSWTTIRRYFELAKRLAGINRRVRFHDLRHTFGSTLASQGVSLQVIAKALGHASVRMSERYARPSEESLQEIRRALDSYRLSAPTAVSTASGQIRSGKNSDPSEHQDENYRSTEKT